MPDEGQPCSTEIKWFVFATEAAIVGISKGRNDLKLITSASMPFEESSFAAKRDVSTDFEWATKVMCLPKQI